MGLLSVVAREGREIKILQETVFHAQLSSGKFKTQSVSTLTTTHSTSFHRRAVDEVGNE